MRSYLIVGNQTLMGPELAAAIAARTVPGDLPAVHVVVPATPRPGAFTWNEDEATADAQGRLDAMLEHLHGLGLDPTGEVGYRDPVEAARDALRSHPADEIILSTLPTGISLARPGCPEPPQIRGECARHRRDRRARTGRDQERLTYWSNLTVLRIVSAALVRLSNVVPSSESTNIRTTPSLPSRA